MTLNVSNSFQQKEKEREKESDAVTSSSSNLCSSTYCAPSVFGGAASVPHCSSLLTANYILACADVNSASLLLSTLLGPVGSRTRADCELITLILLYSNCLFFFKGRKCHRKSALFVITCSIT